MRRSSTKEREPLPKGFGTIWTTVAVDLVGFGIVLPILPQYAEEFGASATTIGVLVASFSLAQLVCAPLWGRLSDRIGRKPVLLISLFGTAVGSLLTGVASGVAGGLALLFIGRILDGASGASVSVAQASVADVAAPRDRPRLMGLLGAAFGVGFVAGPAIGALGALVAPQVPFYLAAILSLANAVVAVRRLPETAPDHRPPVVRSSATVSTTARAETVPDQRRPVVRASATVRTETGDAGVTARDDGAVHGAMARAEAEAELEAELERVGTLDGPQPGTPYDSMAPSGAGEGAAAGGSVSGSVGARIDVRVILRLIAVSFVGMIAFSGFEATFALLTDERFGLELSGTGAVFTVIGIALVAVQVGLVGRVNDRLGESNTLRAGLVCNASGLALLAADGGWATLVPSLLLLVLGQGLITPTLSSAVAGRAGRARGSWLGWQQSAGGLARVLGPILAGAVFQHVGVGAPYVIGAVLALVALSLVPGVAPTVPPATVRTAPTS